MQDAASLNLTSDQINAFWYMVGAMVLSNIGIAIGSIRSLLKKVDRVDIIEKDLNTAFRRIEKLEERGKQ